MIINDTQEVAYPLPDAPSITGPWQKTDKDFSHNAYTLYDPTEERFYYLEQGHLYRKDGINRYTGKAAIAKLADDQGTWQRSRKSLDAFAPPTTPPVIPLNPEQRQAQLQENLQKWNQIKHQDFCTDKLDDILDQIKKDFGDEFSTNLKPLIKEALENARVGRNPADFATPEAYFNHYEDIISNDNNETHQNLVQFSQKTVEAFHDQTIDIKKQSLMKQQLFLNLIVAEYNALIDTLGENRQKLEDKSFAPSPTNCPNTTASRRSSFSENSNDEQPPNNENTGQNTNTQRSSQVAMTAISSPEPDEEKTLKDVQQAVKQAKANYKDWYQHGYTLRNSADSQRGRLANGFFTWARHGSYGQRRAADFSKEIQNADNSNEAIRQINKHLTQTGTRYHRHSFASFLLDELKGIDNSPWQSITPDKNGKYQKEDIIQNQTTNTDANNRFV